MARPPESSDPDLSFRPLEPGDAASVARIWNDAYGDVLPADPKVLEKILGSIYGDPALQWMALERGNAIGFAWGRDDRAPWAASGVGYVSAVAVAGHAQGRGVGTALVDAVEREVRRRGCTAIRLGSDPDHLLPGVPSVAPPRAWAFFRRRGVSFGNAEFDLHLDLRPGGGGSVRGASGHGVRPGPDGHPLPEGFDVVEDSARAVAFVARAFPGRWHEEVARYAAAGVPLLILTEADSAGADQTAGFCAVFPPGAPFVGPSLIWRRALSERAAGLGPIGIAEDRRGRGVGLAFFAEACRWLAARGAGEVVINWTTLAAFYGRAGARVWRTYQRAEAPLAALPAD